MEQHHKYMSRCLQLAEAGLGNVAPNPMVGAVVVHNDCIIGEGYHQQYGGPHAEVNAIASVSLPELLSESTLYVNLEPCSHFGKTPPCANLIIRKLIPRVVVGMQDPNPEVSGRGFEMLRKAGVEVTKSVMEDECRFLNRRFVKFHQKNQPYIILKWAQTIDGFIDRNRDLKQVGPTWITNEALRALVHKWRTEEQAIMIGRRTAEIDNPKLTAR
ncbi:MAG: bifunctional diaminohydroxyphosphoribosylaminopyrimidine deaminase/5-amino-6-(5-phosphoribosylamino)uracil reductase RibD, partial [Bacteroidetes bacterium]|nr:bifunctional diaminohydroxyphosphoribosylaminopyrimidine deaminase/5-amino-6-(5-phosphoribosylamino)uracil reductase RibD [Bacteroidota bacterium]